MNSEEEKEGSAGFGHGRSRLNGVLLYAAAVGSGAVLSLAFPPCAEAGAAWFAVAPLMVMCGATGFKRAFRLGFVFGLGFWIPSLMWMGRLSENGGPAALVFLGVIGLSAWCSVFTGLFGCLESGVWRFWPRKEGGLRDVACAVISAVFWCGLEYLRSVLFTGFGWNCIGASQFENLPLMQLACAGGVYAVSFPVALMNAAVAGTSVRLWRKLRTGGVRGRGFNADLTVALVLLLVCLAWGFRNVSRMRAEDAGSDSFVRIAVVDPSGSCSIEGLDISEWIKNYEDMEDKSRTAGLFKPDLTVWPETSLFYAMPDAELAAATCGFAAEIGSPILAGTTELAANGSENGMFLCYNSSFLFQTNGVVSVAYRKRHLVPFGEYIPLDKVFRGLSKLMPGGYSCVSGGTASTFTFAGGVLGAVLICFEDTFPNLARDSVRAGAQILFSQSNDAWFWGSSEPAVHHVNAVMRAVETGTPLVRCSNKGISAVVLPWGETRGAIEGGFFAQTVSPRPVDSQPTPYVKFGDWIFGIPAAAAAVVFGLAAAVAGKRRRRVEDADEV